MGWELLRVFSKPSFRSLEPAGSSSGALIRDDDAGGGDGCVRAERDLSLSLL